MKKRIAGIAALTGAIAVALGLPAAGTSAAPDVKGPKCANVFLSGEPNYSGTVGGSGTVSGTLTTPTAPSCATGEYTVYVYDASGTNLLGSQTFFGDGVTQEFSYSITFGSAPQFVCVYATSKIGGHVADTAPNNACALREINKGGGAGGFD